MKTAFSRPLALLAVALLPVAAHAEAPRDLDQEEANRQLVVDFYNQFFNEHEVDVSPEVIAEEYI